MTDTIFRSVPEPSIPLPMADGSDSQKNDVAPAEGFLGTEPIEVFEDSGKDILLSSMGIDDEVENMPSEDKEKHQEVKFYLKDIIKQKGLSPTTSSFKRVLDDIKFDMGLDQEADPHVVLDRIGGVIQAWKQLSFIRNPEEKRRMFMKLGKAKSSLEMNRMVFEEMERRSVWQ